MGELTAPLEGASSGRVIEGQSVEVVLYSGELQSRPMAQILNGANTALLRSPDGEWEVLQFLDAEEVGLNRWKLSRLLRGQLGTERAASVLKAVETPFILLDGSIAPVGLQASEIGLELNWRVGTAGKAFSDEFFDTIRSSGGMRGLRPLSPVHPKMMRLVNGDLSFNWIRRGRIDADDWPDNWLGEDIPLGEEREAYRIEIWRDGTLVRSNQISASSWTYGSSERQADLGDAEFQFRVAMIGAKSGPGDFACLDIPGIIN